MDNARRKLRVCLLCVVMAAVVIGLIYYMNDAMERGSMDEGTLVYNVADEMQMHSVANGMRVYSVGDGNTARQGMDAGRDTFPQKQCEPESRA